MTRSVVTGNSDLIRQWNRALVLDLIRQQGPISRADVKRITGLNFTTVTNVTADLVEEGLVHEVGLGSSKGGRKPVLLTLNPTARYVLGCELQSTHLVVALFDLVGKLIERIEFAKLPGTPPEEVVRLVAQALQTIESKTQIPRTRIEGIGVAAPGPLNAEAGVLLTPPNMLGWVDVPLKQMLEEATGLDVIVEKDGNAAALGEVWFGTGQGARDLVLVIVDDGIGAGMISGGRLYRGQRGGAGEIGHTTIDLDGPRCSCGSYGCLEAIASGFALGRKAGEAIRRGVRSQLAVHGEALEVNHILEAAQIGDKLALDLLDECGRTVGIALANTVNMYNPEVIVLAGRLSASPFVLERAVELGKGRAFSVLSESARILPSVLGDQVLVAGAAALVLARIFQGPADLATM